jgi:hypothetical protein
MTTDNIYGVQPLKKKLSNDEDFKECLGYYKSGDKSCIKCVDRTFCYERSRSKKW